MSILAILLLVLTIYLFFTGRWILGLLALAILLLAACGTVDYNDCKPENGGGAIVCPSPQKLGMPTPE